MGQKINIKSYGGWSPLMYAIKNVNFDIVKYLIEKWC
jgi:ankyrin repeat protein